MTLKRRLVISNTLMIVIPVIIALVIALGSLLITWFWVKSIEDKQSQLYISDEEIINLVIEAIETDLSSPSLDRSLTDLHMNVVVYDEAGTQYSFGSEIFTNYDTLLEVVDIIGGSGYLTLVDEAVYAEKRTVNGTNYTVCMLYSYGYDFDYSEYYNALNTRFIIVILVTVISVILSIIITNHFLTRFVFKKIEQSLELLANGVHEIRDGNLDHRIVYLQNDEFAPVCEDFNDMAARLSHSVELTHRQEQNRTELLAGISHDLRSPLTSIKAYVEGLLDGVAKTPQAQRNYMQMIKTKAEDIDNMVSKIFLFSKMDIGDYPYYPEDLDLTQEITSYVKATDEEYSMKGLRISTVQIEPGITLYADPIQLRSIFANILENSLKYKDKPEVYADIHVHLEGDFVRIVMEDNGPGVPDEALGKLFNVFYRGDSSRSNPNSGSGLGLAITAKAVTNMGGTIYAENREQGGLRIIMKIPRVLTEDKNEKNTDH